MSSILLRSPRKRQNVLKVCKHLTGKQIVGWHGEGIGKKTPLSTPRTGAGTGELPFPRRRWDALLSG